MKNKPNQILSQTKIELCVSWDSRDNPVENTAAYRLTAPDSQLFITLANLLKHMKEHSGTAQETTQTSQLLAHTGSCIGAAL